MYTFQCPHCGGGFQIGPNHAARAVACPHCNGAVFVPEMPGLSAEPPVMAAPPQTTPSIPAVLRPVEPSSPSLQKLPAQASESSAGAGAESGVAPPAGVPTSISDTARPANATVPRSIRDSSSADKTTRRDIKNVIVFSVCSVILAAVLWWLLR